MKTALTIAGSDSSGGAGIQADIKTMTANGVFAMSAITALTAQNTTGVTDIFETTPHFLAEQLDAVFTDIYPDAVKIGMVSSAELIGTIADKLQEYGAKHIVVDPVMVATSGSKLLRDDAVDALTARLLPMAEVLTPNIPEAEILSGMSIKNAADMEKAAQTISEKYGCAVLCKGGHQINDADDLLWRSGAGKWFRGRRIDNPNTHGTGCTLSSAIASNLAKGYDLDTSVERVIYLIGKGVESGLAFTIMESVRKGKGLREEWIQTMKEHDVPDWYIWSCKLIKYMFPKAHAAAYVMMAYRIAWYKVFHPLAYYAAFFSIRATSFSYELMCMGKERLEYYMAEIRKKGDEASKKEQDTLKDMRIVQEMYARGFDFVPIDLYKAKAHRFQIIGDKLMPALDTIEGLGDKAAEAVVDAAAKGRFLSKDDFRDRTKVSKTVIDLMDDMDLFGDIPQSNQFSLFDNVLV